MDTNNPQTLVIAIVVAIALIALALFMVREQRHRQSRRLQERFGREYDRTVSEHGDRTKAESELRARERRIEKLKIVALAPAEAARFHQEWNALQSRFVDSPKGVVMEADLLVRELMTKRGYPMGDFERRAADISVDHPALVDTYRAAQAIATRDQRGEASTEELRKAVVYYRTLFDELLEVRSARKGMAHERNEVVHT